MAPYVGQALLLGSLLTSLLLVFFNKATSRFYAFLPILLTVSFGWLIYGHLASDFSLLNVVHHSHTQKPWLYKLAGTWGNHEGSMLLWTLFLSWAGFLAFPKNRQALGLYSLLTFGFIFFLMMTCDPFAASAIIPEEGNDLNPLLQDPLLAIHPPFLYAGYICTSILFIMGVLKMTSLKDWRKWTLLSWTLLTIGLGLGSFWAYYELGWGGWWFWDPVENISLIPWLLLTALLHTLLLPEKNDRRIHFLGYLTFLSCLIGTFVVRSGLLISVHSFAISPERGLFLGILIAFILLPGAWILLKSPTDSPPSLSPDNSSISRPQAIRYGILFLILGSIIVTFGTFYPLILEAFHQSITVGAPYFNSTFIPIMLPLLGLMAIQHWITRSGNLVPQTYSTLLASIVMIILLIWMNLLPLSLKLIPLCLGGWLVLSTCHKGIETRTLKSLSMTLAHAGLGLMVIGMSLTTLLETESLVALKEGESTQISDISLTLDHLEPHKGPNYMCQRAILKDSMGNQLAPEKRFYWTQGIIHNETAIQSGLFHHLYIALGERYDNDSWSFRLYYKPWINLLWGGLILMVLGGGMGLYRRLFLSFFFLSLTFPCQALEIHEQLGDRALEARAKTLGDQLICPTCAGQSLNDSAADEAQLLREIIRQKLLKKESDQEIKDWFIQRYGERVLLTPPLSPTTYILWAFPWILFMLLIGYWHTQFKQKKT